MVESFPAEEMTCHSPEAQGTFPGDHHFPTALACPSAMTLCECVGTVLCFLVRQQALAEISVSHLHVPESFCISRDAKMNTNFI